MATRSQVSEPRPAGTKRVEKVQYVPGHSPAEMQRLMLGAKLWRPITERLLHSAGIGAGMRLLDIGCGAGDVSLLAAQLVGSSGKVVAADRNPKAIALAQERARQAGLLNIETKVAALDDLTDSDFDAVIGRCVLVHQSDPAAFLKKAASLLRTDGILAFEEPDLVNKITPLPRAPGVELAIDMILSALRGSLENYDAGARLTEHFFNAGLPWPNLFGESIIDGGEEPAFYTWLAGTLLTVMPQIERMGLTTDKTPTLEDLEDRLQAAVRDAHSQIESPVHICGWVRL
jgi:ubiquinone/menaquinone biosynthesis C-methylase UbiE